VLKTLAEGMPEIVPTYSGVDVCSMTGLGVKPRTGEARLEATNEAVGFGGHAGGDGADGIMHLSEPGCRNNPVEVLETRSPMFIESYGYRPDSRGAGRLRGGVGVGRAYRFPAPSTGICLVHKTLTKPWSIAGGGVGDRNPGTEREAVRGGSYDRRDAGELLLSNTGGGGRHGDPHERVARNVGNVGNDFVSVESAARDYAEVLGSLTFLVYAAATAQRRAGASAA